MLILMKKIKINQTEKEIEIVIIKLINKSVINFENPNEHNELNILKKLLALLKTNLFINVLEEKYSKG